jgi:hypothetical protein
MASSQDSTPLTGTDDVTYPPGTKMAAIQGLTDAQNAALADVSVGSLILLCPAQVPVVDSESEDDDDGEGDEEDDEDDNEGEDEGEDGHEDEDEDEGGDGNEDEDEDEDEDDGGNEEEGVEPAHQDGDLGEHIEVASLSGSVANDNNEILSDVREDAELHNMSLVTGVTKDLDGVITNVDIVGLEYSARPNNRTRSYQIYGNQCVANLPPDSKPAKLRTGYASGFDFMLCTKGLSLNTFGHMPEQIFTVAPTGDDVRRLMHLGECPAGCDEGFLASVDELHGMVKDYTVLTSNADMHAVCPACVGIDLMKEHQGFRAEIENFLQVANLEAVLDFYGRLNLRRAQLGYPFQQFDEREWNFLFDDMISEDEAEGSEGGYQPWDEANDPNGDVVPRPTSQKIIDSLQVTKYAVVKVDDDTQCIVCCEQFKDEQLVVTLPCKHIFCQGSCILEWLKNNDSCPLCRAHVSGKDDNKAFDSTNDDEMLNEEADKALAEDLLSTMPGAYDAW